MSNHSPSRVHAVLLALVLLLLAAPALHAQWTHRYPKVEGYSHHVYLEGYELPILSRGPVDVAPAPDGSQWAVAARGWLWLLDPQTGVARRLTSGGGMDSQPAWSPDGRGLAFVRDDGRSLRVMLLRLETGEERVLVDDGAIVLHPAFSSDGRTLYYSSAAAGDPDLWALRLGTGERTRLTDERGLELQPVPLPDGERLLYVSKTRAGGDQVRVRALQGGAERTLYRGAILSQTRPALSPDGRTAALALPTDDGWELRLMDLAVPEPMVRLAAGTGVPFAPAWSQDGAHVLYSQDDTREVMQLHRLPVVGGAPQVVPVREWQWGAPTGRLRVRTRLAGGSGPAPARLHVRSTAGAAAGHPLVPDSGIAHFDGQNGLVFFASPGVVELEVPAGEVRVQAVQGLATPLVEATATVAPGETRELTLELDPLWDARAEGWYAGDHHFHLNYGGQFRLEPDDLVPLLQAEDMDVATPLLANLHNRFGDQPLWGWERTAARPLINFGQEVRSHFLGHVGLVGTETLFWPWIWGPGYEVYGRDDRANEAVLRHARAQGAIATYVHPVSRPGPFAEADPPLPVELVADAVLGEVDGLEILCLWSDELGTSDVWYRLLNLGIPVAQLAGTDVMTDFFRTMAVGTTRVYVRPEGEFGWDAYLDALRRGRSFATNGPLLRFAVDGAEPGATTPADGGAEWTLRLASAVPVERVEVLVNGRVVWEGAGLDAPGERTYTGSVALPRGGWVVARAVGGETTRWPAMDSYAFAQSSPVWIGRVGSTEPDARRAAARDLLRALVSAERRLEQAYQGTEIPRLRARFAEARAVLEEQVR